MLPGAQWDCDLAEEFAGRFVVIIRKVCFRYQWLLLIQPEFEFLDSAQVADEGGNGRRGCLVGRCEICDQRSGVICCQNIFTVFDNGNCD